ncbi:MAG TPA: succinate dehydrogenase cytochrome b subunit [Aeromicrobium sp.]|nr:succinate dehydrogenase cytochrome b subunit [Aeromicrobium sp.]HKY57530.1 succinate dehydrogenase cytochrome b subunit [Aeromicrobium sp.]
MATPSHVEPRLVEHSRAARTTIALKVLMAVSGLIFIGFVFGHMYGNLKAFAGHDAFNEYAEHLRTLGTPILPHGGFLWITRTVLIVALVIHVVTGMKLWHRAGRARNVRYQVKKHTGAIPASLILRWAGLAIFLFLIWHLLQFTIVKVNVGDGPAEYRHDPYNLMVDSFQVWWMTLIYLAALTMLGAHLHHGFWAACQTLGFNRTAGARARSRSFSFVLALVITVGFAAVPIAVLLGIIQNA